MFVFLLSFRLYFCIQNIMIIQFMKKILLGCVFASLAQFSFSQEKVKYVEYDLPNGLHVILHEEHATPIVAVSVLYHVGSKNENPNRTGFAHFFEHLLFEGSANIDRGEYAKIVERNGGVLNANTSNDRTYYYEILPSNQLELGIWMEAERMLHARVDQQGVETQREVVKEEKRQRVDNQPYGSFQENMFDAAYDKHPYTWVPIGSMQHLDAAQEIDYVNFYRTFYVPANATLSIAGDINIDATKKMIETYFASIPKGQALNLFRDLELLNDADFKSKYAIEKSKFDLKNPYATVDKDAKAMWTKYSNTAIAIPRPESTFEKIGKVARETIYDNIQLPAVFMGYKIPAETDKDFVALQMLNMALSNGGSSRMNRVMVDEKQEAVAVFSFAFDMEDPGIGLIGCIGAGGSTCEKLESSMDVEIEKIKSDLISEEEFQKIVNQLENELVSLNASVAGIAENLAENYVYFKSTEMINKQMEMIKAVKREDIQRVAKTYLTQDSRVILYYLPKQQ
jgi:zinc protease